MSDSVWSIEAISDAHRKRTQEASSGHFVKLNRSDLGVGCVRWKEGRYITVPAVQEDSLARHFSTTNVVQSVHILEANKELQSAAMAVMG